jgi:hypothetical protein
MNTSNNGLRIGHHHAANAKTGRSLQLQMCNQHAIPEAAKRGMLARKGNGAR